MTTNANLFTLVFATIISVGIIGLTGCDQFGSETDDTSAAAKMPKPTVNVVSVQPQSVPLIKTFAGRTVAYQTADVRPQTTGIIEEVMYREGSMVKKGQPMYRINADGYKSSATGNQAAVGQAQAEVQTAKAAYNSALADLASQEALMEQAYVDVQRLEPLVAQQAISRQQFDQALTRYKTAQAAVTNAQAAVSQAKSSIASSEAGVATAQAQLDASTIDLNRTIVTAPIDGKTDRSSVTVGALVNSGQSTPLVTINQLDPIYVDITQSSAELLSLKQQQARGELSAGSSAVELILEDGTTYPAPGQLSLAEAKVDADTGSVTLRAQFPNDNYLLLPGMFVTAKMVQGLLTDAVLLPQSALIRTPKGDTQVYVVDQANKIKVRPVTTGGTYQGKWIITDGLQAGDNVVAQGGMNVQAGQEVTVKPYLAQAAAASSQMQNNAGGMGNQTDAPATSDVDAATDAR